MPTSASRNTGEVVAPMGPGGDAGAVAVTFGRIKLDIILQMGLPLLQGPKRAPRFFEKATVQCIASRAAFSTE